MRPHSSGKLVPTKKTPSTTTWGARILLTLLFCLLAAGFSLADGKQGRSQPQGGRTAMSIRSWHPTSSCWASSWWERVSLSYAVSYVDNSFNLILAVDQGIR